ncbi:helix-turn-helix domain-containing protein [Curtobacterium sp. MCPF17_002]|uniref:helix-turn-helix domain-containing protein n=1 Tax=Curtobacterium sp. MCPF17_002 TaxID=2175645 RepID=UPI0026C855CD
MAKAAGKYKGRNRKLTDDQIAEARRLISTGVPKTTVARRLGIDSTTLCRMLATPLSSATTDRAASDVVAV